MTTNSTDTAKTAKPVNDKQKNSNEHIPPAKSAEAAKVPVKPAEAPKAPAKTAETAKAPAKPVEAAKVPVKPAEAAKAPAKPAEAAKVTVKPAEAAKSPAKTAEAAKVPVKPAKPAAKKAKRKPKAKAKKKRERTSSSESNISLYIDDAKKERLITREEEVELVKQIKTGNMAARAKLIKANLRFVVSIAKKYQNSGIPLEDLISEGNIGLIVASDRFDPAKGYHFISYAVWWIKQAILKAISEKSRLIRLPLNRANNLIVIEKKAKELSLKFGHEPTIEEIAKAVNIEKDEVQYLMSIAKGHVSLEEQFNSSDVEGNLLDVIEDKNAKPPEQDIIDDDLHNALKEAMDGLTETEQKVIAYRYGLNGEHPRTLKEIGEDFSLTKERIRQIEKKALRKMRHPSRAKSLKNFVE
ncbi:MAG: sigma-70 family RNA polymerase sigma factor [Spirochaetes bacterium]|nr:sigma-70 family RNA polymerase sigma factor [Spirochaetota bacterium]